MATCYKAYRWRPLQVLNAAIRSALCRQHGRCSSTGSISLLPLLQIDMLAKIERFLKAFIFKNFSGSDVLTCACAIEAEVTPLRCLEWLLTSCRLLIPIQQSATYFIQWWHHLLQSFELEKNLFHSGIAADDAYFWLGCERIQRYKLVHKFTFLSFIHLWNLIDNAWSHILLGALNLPTICLVVPYAPFVCLIKHAL